MTTIEFTLDSKSIGDAIDKIRNYRKQFEQKCQRVVSELAELGYQTAYRILSEHVFDGETLASLRVEQVTGADNIFVISAKSEAILILEFGSGLPAANSPHPEASKHGMGAGTLSEKGHFNDPNGWYYPTDDPRLIKRYNKDGTQGYGHSKGMKPQMPFYTAARDIERQIADVVGRVIA